MSELQVYLVYAATLMLSAGPLLHIVARRKLRLYFVFFVFGCGHLFLNVVASVSPNIRRNVPTDEFHLLLFVTALALCAVYVFLLLLAARIPAPGPIPLRVPGAGEAAAYRTLVRTMFGGACVVSLAFYALVAPPVILRFDLFGQWQALINERWRVVYEVGTFHWFALAFFEIPLLVLILGAVLSRVHASAGRPAEARAWGRAVRWMLPVAMFLAVGFLHIIVLVYLLTALAMVAAYFRGRIPLRMALRYGTPTLLAIFLLYFVKRGFVLSGAFLAAVSGTVVHRILEVNAWTGATATWLFPQQMPYLRGRSLTNLFGVFDWEQVDLARILYPYIYNDTTGGAPAPALFESWANFGWAGALATVAVICALAVAVTVMSWSRSVFVFSLSLFLTLKSLLLWQAALWFGVLEPTLLVLLVLVSGWFMLLRGGGAPVRRPALA